MQQKIKARRGAISMTQLIKIYYNRNFIFHINGLVDFLPIHYIKKKKDYLLLNCKCKYC